MKKNMRSCTRFFPRYVRGNNQSNILHSKNQKVSERTSLRNNIQSRYSSRYRQIIFIYSLLSKNGFFTVCKCMFPIVSTFAIVEKFVRHIIEINHQMILLDRIKEARHTPKIKRKQTCEKSSA